MLKLQLTRDGAYDDEYLELPATPADVGEVMSQLDETSSNVASTRIYGTISDVWNIGRYLKRANVNDPDQLKKLNRIALPPDNRKFVLRPASPNEAGFFYALPKEQDEALGAIGLVRIDFGRDGDEFWHTWQPRGDESLNSPEFQMELTELINELRETGPLKNLNAMTGYCGNRGGEIEGGWRQNYGYVIETERYRYCLRCNPGPGDYHAYLTAFDLQVQRMNMKQEAPEQEHGLTKAGKEMLRNAADNARPHSYNWFVFQDYNTPGEKFTGGLTLPEAIQLYNDIGSGNKRLGVTKDGIATVDLAITLNGEQELPEDYTRLASFSGDPVITEAVEKLRGAITEQTPEQGITMGGL